MPVLPVVGGHVVEEVPQHPFPSLAPAAGERPEDLNVLGGELGGEGLELALVPRQVPMDAPLPMTHVDELMDQGGLLDEQGIAAADEDADAFPHPGGHTGLAGR